VFWRRRLVVLLLVAVVAVGAATATRAVLSRTADAAAPQIEVAVVLAPGQTLWDLARRYAPDGADRSAWVTRVADSNNVDPGALQAGTSLLLPLEGATAVTAVPGADATP
jgi:hypothetical protein